MNLRELRKQRGWNQTEFAKKIGMSQTNYSYYEKNNIMPDSKTLVKIANIYGVSVDNLLDVEPYATSEDLIDFDVLGTIKAGYDGEAVEMPTGETIPIPKQFLKGYRKKDFIVLRVSGDSMYPKFLDGDFVLIHKKSSVDSGSVACILYDGNDATIKTVKYVRGEDWLELIPTNPEYPTKRIEGADLESCRVIGQVVKLIRDI